MSKSTDRDSAGSAVTPDRHERTSPREWAVVIVSLVIILVLLGILVYQAVGKRPPLPVVRVTVERVRPEAPGYLAEFVALNAGSTEASQLELAGTLTDATGAAEATMTGHGYRPVHGNRRSRLYFSDARRAGVHLSAIGTSRPREGP